LCELIALTPLIGGIHSQQAKNGITEEKVANRRVSVSYITCKDIKNGVFPRRVEGIRGEYSFKGRKEKKKGF